MGRPLTRGEHRVKAETHRAALEKLLGEVGTFPEWVVITAFYTALHTVDQLLVELQQETGSHEKRQWTIGQSHARGLHLPYSSLSTAAHIARYGSQREFRETYPTKRILDIYAGNFLPTIERYVQSQLERIDASKLS